MVVTSFRARAAMPAAVGAVAAAMALGFAPTGYADDSWGAIAVSPDGQSVGTSTDEANEYLANKAAEDECRQNNPVCNVLITFKSPDCGAIAKNGDHYFGDSGATAQEAEQNAMNQSPGSEVLHSACNGAPPEGEGSSTTPAAPGNSPSETAPAATTQTTPAPAPGG